jgi:uncharacterized protein (DUF2236 family)
LPVELRKQYGLPWSELDQILFDTFAAASRKIHTSKFAKLIPNNIRFTTYYRRSLRKHNMRP